jgi:serine/threonine protein kinase
MKAADTIAPDIDSLVAEVADRFTEEVKQGLAPDIEEYTQRHPEIATIIRQVFPALAVLGNIEAGAMAVMPGSPGSAPAVPGSPDSSVVRGSPDPAHPASSIEHPASSVVRGSPDPAHPTSSPAMLGDFRILRELGRGGMGIVYEAEQLSLGRRVALKVLPFAAMLDGQQLARFKNEARAAATLDHPNIVAIYSVGCERGVHYHAMQLIEGQSLAEVIDALRAERKEQRAGRNNSGLPAPRSPLPAPAPGRPSADSGAGPPSAQQAQSPAGDTVKAALSTLCTSGSAAFFRTVAELGIQAAEALDHAHQNGILHRDIKPANLLVDCSGIGNNSVKLSITDFGLARMEADAGITMTGDILGTLRYMSPEQALAKRAIVDHRSDIYSLGITLYELLTLEPAFSGDDRQELLKRITFDEPRPLRQASAHIPPDLATIIQKAIEKEPADRYATAKDFSDDFRAFLEHRPIVARQATLMERARKWSRRHPAAVWAISFFLLATTLVSAISAVLISRAYQRETTQRQVAQQHLGLAREAVDEMLTKVASTWVPESTATSAIQEEFLQRALAIYQQLASNPPDGNPRGADAASAHERIANIQIHLGEFAAATSSLQTAVEICQELETDTEFAAARAEQLARCYRKLAHSLHRQSKSAQALNAAEQGLLLAQQVVSRKAATPQLNWELARMLYIHAELLIAQGKLAEASEAIHQAYPLVEARFRDPVISIEDHVLYPQLTNLEANILRSQGHLDKATQLVRPAIAALWRMRSRYPDSKQMLVADADLHETLGEILLDQGKPQEAVEQFRESLGFRKQRLGGRTPTEQGFTVMFDRSRPVSWRHVEPLVIADYCDTQLRLAEALHAIGRPYEAGCVLGDAAFNAQIVNDSRRDILQFWVLHANAAAAVGEHLAERESTEAEHYFQLAAALWNEVLAGFPQAQQFQSGMHGTMRDWDWFSNTHPDQVSEQGTRESLKLDNWTTAFWNHMLGRAWFQNEAWQDAVRHFKKSAELRKSGQAYDWLHLAMAYHHLGQHEKAKTEYDRAVTQIKEATAPDAELESLRRTAGQVLSENGQGDSN